MRPFKIAAAQVPSVRGNIDRNIATHMAAMTAAAKHDTSVLVFPELSVTGYETDLAADLAMTADAKKLAPLIALAREYHIDAIVGVPLHNGALKPAIGAIVIGADGVNRTYRKMHLGSSEKIYFTPGDTPMVIARSGYEVGVAICADASQPAHPQWYADSGVDIYAAGVFLNEEWYTTDMPRLASYAERFRMLTVMANHAASKGTYLSVGRSAIWSPNGELLAQVEGTESALVIATSDSASWRGEVFGF